MTKAAFAADAMTTDAKPATIASVVQPTAAPAAAPVQPAAAAAAPPPAAPAPKPAAAAAAPQQRRQQQAAAPKQPQTSLLDAVIDEVLGGDFAMQERKLMADEVAYSYFSSVREAAGDQLDPQTSAELNRLAALSQAETGKMQFVWESSAVAPVGMHALALSARGMHKSLSSAPSLQVGFGSTACICHYG